MLNLRETTPAFRQLFLPDGQYKVLKPMTINGQTFERGDMLPSDSPLRNMATRLRLLCQQNSLVPVIADSEPIAPRTPVAPQTTSVKAETTAAPDPPAKPKKEPQVKLHLDDKLKNWILGLPMVELQAECRKRGISVIGNKSQLRKRLAVSVAR